MRAYPPLVSPPSPPPAPFCANGPFQVRWLMIVPQRHWHGTATALRWDCHLSAAAPTRHCHGTGTPPHLLCKRTVFGALVDDSPAPALARHAPAVRRECYWTATGPQRHCGTDDGDTGNWKMVAMMAIIAMLSIYPSSKQPGPQPLPPSAGGAHVYQIVAHCVYMCYISLVNVSHTPFTQTRGHTVK